MAPLHSSLVASPLLAFPAPQKEPEKAGSWTGKVVVMKQYGTQMYRDNPGGEQPVVTAVLNRTDYFVYRDDKDKIWIKQDGAEGWILKESAALANEEGLDYFNRQVKENPKDHASFARRSKLRELKGDLDGALEDYNQALLLAPNSYAWHNNRGNLYLKKKDYAKAIADYQRAIELNPTSFFPYGNRGNAYNALGEYDKAITDYNEAIRLNPNNVSAYANRGNSFREKQQFDAALADYQAALKIDPQYSYALAHRGSLFLYRKEYEKAQEDLYKAMNLDQQQSITFLFRGNLWRARKDIRKAMEDYDHAIWLAPTSANAYVERGSLYQELKRYDRASADFEEALKQEPKAIVALNGVAWFKATCPEAKYRDGKKAVELATEACERTQWKGGNQLDTLAAAYAEAGNFEEAIKTMHKALEDKDFAREKGDEARERLKLFEAHRAYHAE